MFAVGYVATDDDGAASSLATRQVTVRADTTVTLTPSTVRLGVGECSDVMASAFDHTGVPITDPLVGWVTRNNDVARYGFQVTNRSLAAVRGWGVGSTYVVASVGNGSDSVAVNVTADRRTVFTPDPIPDLELGDTLTLTARYMDGATVEQDASFTMFARNSAVAIATARTDSTVLLTAVGGGTTHVVATRRGCLDGAYFTMWDSMAVTVDAPANIFGYVRRTGFLTPIPNKSVTLIGPTNATDTTLPNGRFNFRNVADGSYTVSLDPSEFSPFAVFTTPSTIGVEIVDGQSISNLNFRVTEPTAFLDLQVNDSSVTVGDTITASVVVTMSDSPLTLGGIDGSIRLGGSAGATLVSGSVSGPVWSSGLTTNESPAGTLNFAGANVDGIPEGAVEVLTFRVSFDASGQLDFRPFLDGLELVDPVVGQTYDLIDQGYHRWTVPAVIAQ